MPASRHLADLHATELLPLYRRKELSPRDVIDAVFERIDRYDALFHPFCHLDREAANAAATASESRWMRGKPAGLLDGVPTTIKDLILTKGWPTLRGSLTTDPAQPWNVDAPVTARLREHGAVIIGKTTTPEFGWKGACDSPQSGLTRNPWNPELTPGGSSGGAAVAAALGMGALHVGTDGGGSIRIPSSFTGVFGLKPTFGRVPAYPLSPFGAIAHLGPMTTSVADAARMLTVMAEPDARDWHGLPPSERDFSVGLDAGIGRLRVAFSMTLGYAEVEAEVREAVLRAANVLADLGAVVEERDPGFPDPNADFETLWLTGAANLRDTIPKNRWPLLDPGFARFADAGESVTLKRYLGALARCGAMGTHMGLFHEQYDVLVTPTLPIAAFPVNRIAPPDYKDQRTWVSWTPFTFPFNMTQQPAASIPCGLTKAGLPIGLQIVGAKYRDDLVLRVARAFESAVPIVKPPPLRQPEATEERSEHCPAR
jgi:aspartyl-tRNA(Asn)/glutamyl-tRNA(Gln) amidotransferase subunit A